MSGTPEIRVEVEEHVGILTIDRPDKLNALTLDMIHVLREEASRLDRDRDVWVILLRSTGERAFCVGGDLTGTLPQVLEAGKDLLNPDPSERFFSDVYTPIVVAVQGLCLGGGFELMLGTDIRIVADDASFGLPEGGIGLIPGSGTTVRLPRQLPWAFAMDLLLSGDRIDAATARAMGLVTQVVPAAELGRLSLDKARRLTANGPLAMRTAKESAVRSFALAPAFAEEYRLNTAVITSGDARRGVASFADRSTPEFHNE